MTKLDKNLDYTESVEEFTVKTKVSFSVMNKIFSQLLSNIARLAQRINIYIWHCDSDLVTDENGSELGTLSNCMNDNFIGAWFYVRTQSSEAGSAKYPEQYEIDGANGYLSLRDYVEWTGKRLVHISAFEAKASTAKNADGKYSPKSGVDGLFSSTDKAYLTDMINSYWGKEKLPVYSNPDPAEGWLVNWLFDTGWYLGGIKKDCGGHPPVLNNNHTSWAVLVLNGMAMDAESLNHNHRLQIAFDVVNSKIYMRRGWMSENTWADNWDEVGAIADGSVTADKLSSALAYLINETAEKAHIHVNKDVLDGITAEDIQKLNEIAAGANKYTHPTTAGNKHIPAGGSEGQILRFAADGTAYWDSDNIGSMDALNTQNKTNIVAAINEILTAVQSMPTAISTAESGSIEITDFTDNYAVGSVVLPIENQYEFIRLISLIERRTGERIVSSDVSWHTESDTDGVKLVIRKNNGAFGGGNYSYYANYSYLKNAASQQNTSAAITALEAQLNGITFNVDENGHITAEIPAEEGEE